MSKDLTDPPFILSPEDLPVFLRVFVLDHPENHRLIAFYMMKTVLFCRPDVIIARQKVAGQLQHRRCLYRAELGDVALLLTTIVLKAVTHGCGTWPLTKDEENMLEMTESAVKRKISGMCFRDQIDNQTVRQKRGARNVVVAARKKQHLLAKHVTSLAENE